MHLHTYIHYNLKSAGVYYARHPFAHLVYGVVYYLRYLTGKWEMNLNFVHRYTLLFPPFDHHAEAVITLGNGKI
jgi:hypothetical protein